MIFPIDMRIFHPFDIFDGFEPFWRYLGFSGVFFWFSKRHFQVRGGGLENLNTKKKGENRDFAHARVANSQFEWRARFHFAICIHGPSLKFQLHGSPYLCIEVRGLGG